MGDLLGSPRVAPLFFLFFMSRNFFIVMFFYFSRVPPSHFDSPRKLLRTRSTARKFIINQKTGLGPWGSWGLYGGIIINICIYIYIYIFGIADCFRDAFVVRKPVERFHKLLGVRGASLLFK